LPQLGAQSRDFGLGGNRLGDAGQCSALVHGWAQCLPAGSGAGGGVPSDTVSTS
jgi:hypothetical protein